MDVALVTGASSGIGEAFARLLTQKGYHVVLVARREQRLRELATELTAGGGSAEVLVADLLTREGLDRVCTRIRRDRVDLLVNNAGIGLYGPVAETDETREREMIRLHVEVPVTLLRAVLPQMKNRGSGGMIQVGSTSSFLPTPYMTAYGAAKAFLLHYGEALAAELRGSGVTLTTLCPGSTESEFAQRTGIRQSNQMPAEQVARLGFSAWQKGRPVVVTGTLNRFLIFLPASSPAPGWLPWWHGPFATGHERIRSSPSRPPVPEGSALGVEGGHSIHSSSVRATLWFRGSTSTV